ncbi:alkaline phosphatase family protein [Crateriforma spongiae]|uniref:hypothetical protein n=1 Tax=Crateriforma spongiae TaxID=2724528 RepID=UPI001446F430|nr:hypothetical protein [Crateriforma spongiae]
MTRQIVITLEGLSVDAIGCYGSAFNQTPTIDAMASDGFVWDRLVCHDDRPDVVLATLVSSRHGGLLIDDGTMPSVGRAFDSVQTMPIDSADKSVANRVEDTHFSRLVQSLDEAVNADSPAERIWLHSGFLARHWDAPRDLFPVDESWDDWGDDDQEFLDTEPPGTASGGVPQSETDGEGACPPIFEGVEPPVHPVVANDPVDLIMAWMRTYGCQVRLIDQLLDRCVDLADQIDATLILMGTSGFNLGQNGWIGHGCGPLRSAQIQVPLIVRTPQGIHHDVGMRWPKLTGSQDVAATVIAEDLVDRLPFTAEQWAADSDDTFDPMLVTQTETADRCVNTGGWFYVRDRDQSEHLYLKPDDRHDHNDVGRLAPDALDRLSTDG